MYITFTKAYVAWFDQTRRQLRRDKTLRFGGEEVETVLAITDVADKPFHYRFDHTGCPAPNIISFPLSGIMSDNFTHCTG
jgi:hypothetical protein